MHPGQHGIRYVMGDATTPDDDGPVLIAHVCNDIGGWGRGFVTALSNRWAAPEAEYRRWYDEGAAGGFELGAVQFVQVEPSMWVANMVGQRGIRRSSTGRPPVRYDAIEHALGLVADRARADAASVHMPRIGCGLAGGDWSRVESIIEGTLIAAEVEVVVYDLP